MSKVPIRDPNKSYVQYHEEEEREKRKIAIKAGSLPIEVHEVCNSEISRVPGTEEPYCPRCKVFNVPYKRVRYVSTIKMLEDK